MLYFFNLFYILAASTNNVLNYVDVNVIKNSKCVGFYGPEVVQAAIICATPYEENVPCAVS